MLEGDYKQRKMFKLQTASDIYLKIIKERWEELQLAPTVFAYELNVTLSRYLEGDNFFYVEVSIYKRNIII